jgi:hypothetical protein
VKAEPNNWWAISDVAALYSRYYAEARLRRAENAILAPLGLTSATFLQQQQLAPQLVTQLATELINFEAPHVQTLVIGNDLTGGHIYRCNDGDVSCHDGEGFASIGIGHAHANSQFMFGGHSKWKPMPESFLMTFFAKKRAEVAPGVGTATDMLMMGPELGASIQIGETALTKLSEIWNKAQLKRKELEREAEEEIKQYVQSLADAATPKDQAAAPDDGSGTQTADQENKPTAEEARPAKPKVN